MSSLRSSRWAATGEASSNDTGGHHGNLKSYLERVNFSFNLGSSNNSILSSTGFEPSKLDPDSSTTRDLPILSRQPEDVEGRQQNVKEKIHSAAAAAKANTSSPSKSLNVSLLFHLF